MRRRDFYSNARWRSARKALGPEHPAKAASLNNLAALLQDQGDLERPRPLYERAE
ncbi:MAG TPA: tetratricopeptide repeat protein [Xanthobacteraceae bacterium]|nr:tetratricopeptide repeat protein [Xanthobacteraceae bacterium]